MTSASAWERPADCVIWSAMELKCVQRTCGWALRIAPSAVARQGGVVGLIRSGSSCAGCRTEQGTYSFLNIFTGIPEAPRSPEKFTAELLVRGCGLVVC